MGGAREKVVQFRSNATISKRVQGRVRERCLRAPLLEPGSERSLPPLDDRVAALLLFAATCVQLGRADSALEVLSEALGALAQSEERWLEPELHRLRGEIVASQDMPEAQRSFVTAIQLAQSHGATSLELRATLSLYKVVSGPTKRRARNEVARLLPLVAGGEGTPDVAEARRVVGS